MIRKVGQVLTIERASNNFNDIISKTASKVVEPVNSDFLYFRAKAIKADEPNGNGDYFPKVDLIASYQTFVGKGLFLNHDSDDLSKAIGKVLDSYPIEANGEFYIECLAKIDKKLYPEIARKVETGVLSKVSMGCGVERSTCNICGHVLYSDDDMKCAHLSGSLLKEAEAQIDFPKVGIKKGSAVKVFAINEGISFTELSIVNVPAWPNADINSIISSLKETLSKTASLNKDEIVTQLKEILASLDNETRNIVKDNICQCKLEENMSNVEHNENELDSVLKKLNALEYMTLISSLEKKVGEQKAEKDNLVEKAKNSLAGKLFKQTLKRLSPKATQTEVDKVVEDLSKKYLSETSTEEVESMYKPIFIKEANLEDSYWLVLQDNKHVIRAKLKDIWGEKLEFFKDYAVSKRYGENLVKRLDKIGVEKVAELFKPREVTAAKDDAANVKPTVETNIGLKDVKTSDVDGVGAEITSKDTAHESAHNEVRKVLEQNESKVEKSQNAIKTEYKAGEAGSGNATKMQGESLPEGRELKAEQTKVAEDTTVVVDPPVEKVAEPAVMPPSTEEKLDGKIDTEKIKEDLKPSEEKSKDEKKEEKPKDKKEVEITPEEAVECIEESLDILEDIAKDKPLAQDAIECIYEDLEILEDVVKGKEPKPKKEKKEKKEEKKEEKVEVPGLPILPVEEKKEEKPLPGIVSPELPKTMFAYAKLAKLFETTEESLKAFEKECPKCFSNLITKAKESGVEVEEKKVEAAEYPSVDAKKAEEEKKKVEEEAKKKEEEAKKESTQVEEKKVEATVEKVAADVFNDADAAAAEVARRGGEAKAGMGKTQDGKWKVYDKLSSSEVSDKVVKSQNEIELEQKVLALEAEKALEQKKAQCTDCIKDMLDRDLIDMFEEDVQSEIAVGKSLLDARHLAFKKAIDSQMADLMKMDESALTSYASAVKRMKKVASTKSTSVLINSPKFESNEEKWLE